jgi:hypothetical protein
MPRTYTQAPQIDDLIDIYGSRLEEMEPEDKLALRLTLAGFVYVREVSDTEDLSDYTLADAFEDAIAGNDATSGDFSDRVLPTLEGISVRGAEGLIEAITAQLKAA